MFSVKRKYPLVPLSWLAGDEHSYLAKPVSTQGLIRGLSTVSPERHKTYSGLLVLRAEDHGEKCILFQAYDSRTTPHAVMRYAEHNDLEVRLRGEIGTVGHDNVFYALIASAYGIVGKR